MKRIGTALVIGVAAVFSVTLAWGVQAGEGKRKKKAQPDWGVNTVQAKMDEGWDASGCRKGLAAHYYRDKEDWEGQWPATESVPKGKADDHTFTTYKYTRIEPLINHRFIRRGWFSVRWQGMLDTSPAGAKDLEAEYTFRIWADDGCRLFVDGKAVIDDWRACAENDLKSIRAGTITLKPGKHAVRVEYFQGQSLQKKDRDPIKLYWECKARKIPNQIIPAAHFSHTRDDLKVKPGRLDKAEVESRVEQGSGAKDADGAKKGKKSREG